MEVLEQKIKNAVCRIEMKDKNCCEYEGTGFLFGDGWVMTAAHNFQDNTERNKGIQNFLQDASFKVSFHVRDPDSPDGTIKKYEFRMQKRMAFAHHRQPGDKADFKNKDIAMVKLGVQYEYGRGKEDYKEWEKEEKEQLNKLREFVTPLSHTFNIAERGRSITPGSSVYAVYYQVDGDEKELKEIKAIDVTEDNQSSVSVIRLEKPKGVLRAGTSGCPILAKKEGASGYTLAGLHFSGDKDDRDGEANALSWNESILGYINNGTHIITNIAAYFAYKKVPDNPNAQNEVEENRQALKDRAKNNNLTIYLFDGEVIPPPSIN